MGKDRAEAGQQAAAGGRGGRCVPLPASGHPEADTPAQDQSPRRGGIRLAAEPAPRPHPEADVPNAASRRGLHRAARALELPDDQAQLVERGRGPEQPLAKARRRAEPREETRASRPPMTPWPSAGPPPPQRQSQAPGRASPPQAGPPPAPARPPQRHPALSAAGAQLHQPQSPRGSARRLSGRIRRLQPPAPAGGQQEPPAQHQHPPQRHLAVEARSAAGGVATAPIWPPKRQQAEQQQLVREGRLQPGGRRQAATTPRAPKAPPQPSRGPPQPPRAWRRSPRSPREQPPPPGRRRPAQQENL
ncbi:unnamed protein product [Prorocentrum cordatum]|uniref:Uncharacterized protein n=1 Tax=Prorocentrum cordatum TaxID=2364126 RepID=A0ABN9VRR1_9DINO|nr:unnamed protein product [Polarella glacialis]